MKITQWLAAVCLMLLAACTPYTAQLNALERDYKAGKISTNQYWKWKTYLQEEDCQFRAQLSQNMAVATQQIQQNNYQQQQINAYNARTSAIYANSIRPLAYPTTPSYVPTPHTFVGTSYAPNGAMTQYNGTVY